MNNGNSAKHKKCFTRNLDYGERYCDLIFKWHFTTIKELDNAGTRVFTISNCWIMKSYKMCIIMIFINFVSSFEKKLTEVPQQ